MLLNLLLGWGWRGGYGASTAGLPAGGAGCGRPWPGGLLTGCCRVALAQPRWAVYAGTGAGALTAELAQHPALAGALLNGSEVRAGGYCSPVLLAV
ncbi:MAG: hypothetical protein WKG07_19495 [Hymenobacter sp.]